MPVLFDWFAPNFEGVSYGSGDMVRKRWQFNFTFGRFDVSFPHGPRDYPWRVERKEWLAPRLRVSKGIADWPCWQVHIWRLYVRYWYGEWRWSAEAQDMVRT